MAQSDDLVTLERRREKQREEKVYKPLYLREELVDPLGLELRTK
jgi:hypothetical protein